MFCDPMFNVRIRVAIGQLTMVIAGELLCFLSRCRCRQFMAYTYSDPRQKADTIPLTNYDDV